MKPIYNHQTKIRFIVTLVCSGLAVTVKYLISLVLTPYITDTLGTEAYGFVSFAKTFSDYAIIVTACLNAYAARFITIAFHKDDKKAANKYYSTVILANLALSGIIFIISAVVIWKLDLFVNIPQNLIRDVKVLFLLDFVNYMMVATGTAFLASAYIKNRLDLVGLIKVGSYTIEAIALIVFFKNFDPKVYFVGYALIISSLVIIGLNYWMTRVMTPELSIQRKSFDFSAVRELVISGIWNSFNSLGNVLNSGLDLWISNILLSAKAMGELSIVKTLSTIFTTLFQVVSQPFQPILLKKYSEKDIAGVTLTLKRGIKISGYFSNMLFAGLVAVGLTYYRLWTPNQNTQFLYSVTIVTIIGSVIEGAVFPLFYVYTLTLKNRVPCIVTILSGVLNVAGMYVLLTFYHVGLYGVVGTTTVLGWFVYFIFTPLYTSHCLKISKTTFYSTLIRVIVSCVAITGCLELLTKIYMPISWISLILYALVGCVMGLPIHILITADSSDYKILFGMVKKTGKKAQDRIEGR
ncbi:MAG: oligosaccharide flippase family protein [Syntrophomonas sp.]